MNNPLTDFSGLPRFAEIEPGHVAPAIDELLAQGRLRHVFVDAATWTPVAAPDWIRSGLAPYALEG